MRQKLQVVVMTSNSSAGSGVLSVSSGSSSSSSSRSSVQHVTATCSQSMQSSAATMTAQPVSSRGAAQAARTLAVVVFGASPADRCPGRGLAFTATPRHGSASGDQLLDAG